MRCKETIVVMLSVMLLGSVAMADYGYRANFAPGWEGETGYTVQDWGLDGVGVNGDEEPAQPLTADNGYTNPYAAPTCVWTTHTPEGFFAWGATAMGSHPDWVEGVYGGMVQMAGGGCELTATVNPGTEDGLLRIWVEYDWYNYGNVSANIAGASDVTPASYSNYQIGMSGSNHEWYRTVQVFEFTENPDTAFDVVFDLTGFAPMMDSFEISTAVGASIPPTMPVPEPATMVLLATGGLGIMLRRKRRKA